MKNNLCRIAALTLFVLVFTFTASAQYTETMNVPMPGLYTDSPLVADTAGNFYGATGGGTGQCYPYGCGEIFQLPPGAQQGNIIYDFTGTTDGSAPTGHLTIDANGNLYGVARSGGNLSDCGGSGCGVVFELSPNTDGTWSETVLYAFAGGKDGSSPHGGVVFDSKGNLYGSAAGGGIPNCYGNNQDCGLIFELARNASGGWTKTNLHTFTGGSDGGVPSGLLTLDQHDNFFGTAVVGGNTACQNGCGTVFRLTRTANSTWSFSRLYSFNGTRGQNPNEGLVFDRAGNLYGSTVEGGKSVNNSSYCPFATCGVVYELVHQSNGTWRQALLHEFTGFPDGSSPSSGGLTLDAAGNVYGTAAYGGPQDCGFSGYSPGCGTAFKISPASGGGWIFNRIYGFTGGDGEIPNGGLLLDSSGNLFGTTVVGFTGYGNIFELSPNSAHYAK